MPSVLSYTNAFPGIPEFNILYRPIVFWGLRAYFAGQISSAIDIVDQAGSNQTTISFLLSGNLDVASINAWVTAHSVTTIKIKKVYDQTGKGNHLVQTTLANMPTLNLTAVGGTKPAMDFNGSTFYMTATSSITQSQPYTVSTFFNIIDAGTGAVQVVLMNGNPVGANIYLWGDNGQPAGGPTDPAIAAGSSNLGVYPVPINIFHAVQGVYNGASSDYNFDSVPNTGGTIGSNGMASTTWIGCSGSINSFAYMHLCELSIWPYAFSGERSRTANHDQHAYWGI